MVLTFFNETVSLIRTIWGIYQLKYLLLKVSLQLRFKLFPSFKRVISCWAWSDFLFFVSKLFWYCSISFHEFSLSKWELFVPIYQCIVNWPRNIFMQLCLHLSEILLRDFVLLSQVGFQQICALHFWHLIEINTEGLNFQRMIYYLLYTQAILRTTCFGLLW